MVKEVYFFKVFIKLRMFLQNKMFKNDTVIP